MHRILIVDDEPDMLQTIENLLEISFPQCRFTAATDGQSALEMTMRDRPDVIVTDLKMPRLDGFELARRIEQSGADIPMLLMTAFSDSGLEAKASAFPLIRHFIKKPIDPPALLDAIRCCLPD